MHLAILMTNTDESAFADAHPRDGAKFTDMIRSVRPDWTTEVFAVKDGIFPGDLARFDGVMITGSPASVNDGDAWTARLLDLIRVMVAEGVPIFGACYGHQAVAKALGGSVGANAGGFVHGLNRNDGRFHLPRRAFSPGRRRPRSPAWPSEQRSTPHSTTPRCHATSSLP